MSTVLVHDANLGATALARGCTDLVLAGHLHAQVGPDRVLGENGEIGEIGYTYTNGTTGGAAYAIALGSKPRIVFASSIAVFGGKSMPKQVGDDTKQVPQTTYGMTKAIGELLVNDYSRKGFVDGRAVRLPTIVVRPGRPNKAASTFASSILRS